MPLSGDHLFSEDDLPVIDNERRSYLSRTIKTVPDIHANICNVKCSIMLSWTAH
jgi:hypothetical protein